MNDLEAIKSVLEKHQDNTSLHWALIVLMGLNLIAALANFFLQIYLKSREEKQYRLKIREDRRITIYEQIYKLLEELTYFDGRENNDVLLQKIAAIEKYMSENGIYVSKEIQHLCSSGMDYYRSITTDYRKKDYGLESLFLTDFVRLFNK